MTDILSELKNAVITVLAGDGVLGPMVNGVYDNVPQDVKYPFIAVDNINARAEDNLARKGFQVGINVVAYSRARDSAEASGVAAEIRRVLLGAELVVDGAVVVSASEGQYVLARGKDGVTWGASLGFVVVLRDESDFR